VHAIKLPLLILLSLSALAVPCQVAHMNQPILNEDTSRMSGHVWQITDFPKSAIVVGNYETLVVDTALAQEMVNGGARRRQARVAQFEAAPADTIETFVRRSSRTSSC
jgi:hypothetical protein